MSTALTRSKNSRLGGAYQKWMVGYDSKAVVLQALHGRADNVTRMAWKSTLSSLLIFNATVFCSWIQAKTMPHCSGSNPAWASHGCEVYGLNIFCQEQASTLFCAWYRKRESAFASSCLQVSAGSPHVVHSTQLHVGQLYLDQIDILLGK